MKKMQENDPIHYEHGFWWFWDEIWADKFGPFSTSAQAREALEKYAADVLGDHKKTIYIAGPMTGYPQFNFPAFFEAQRKLEAEGWKVYNPADKDEEADLDPAAVKTGDDKLAIKKGFDFRAAFLWDAEKVIKGDAIYMLKGWERSPGARTEHTIACLMQSKYPEYEIHYERED